MKNIITLLLILSLTGCMNSCQGPDKIKIPGELMAKPKALQKL